MKVLIIEDQEPSRVKLTRLLKSLDVDMEIVGFLTSAEDSIRWFLSNPRPEIIFMDVMLEDADCFEIFKEVRVNTPIVFTAENTDYALKAFSVNAIDYLIKPIERNAVIGAMQKLKTLTDEMALRGAPDFAPERYSPNRSVRLKSRFMVQIGDKFNYVRVEDIAYFKAEGNIVYLWSKASKQFIIDYSLEEITERLNPDYFFRLNRTFLANISAIKEVHKYFNSRLKVNLSPATPEDDEILVSRNRVPEFLEWLGN